MGGGWGVTAREKPPLTEVNVHTLKSLLLIATKLPQFLAVHTNSRTSTNGHLPLADTKPRSQKFLYSTLPF